MLETAGEVAARAGQQLGGGQRQPRAAIGEDAGACIARGLPARHHHRHRNDPGVKAAEERDETLDPHREQQQRAFPREGAAGDLAGQRGGAAVELGEGDRRILLAAIGQRHIGAVVRLHRGAMAEQGGQRG